MASKIRPADLVQAVAGFLTARYTSATRTRTARIRSITGVVIFAVLIGTCVTLGSASPYIPGHAPDGALTYVRATVTDINSGSDITKLTVRLAEGPDKGEFRNVSAAPFGQTTPYNKISEGARVLLVRTDDGEYVYTDRDRLGGTSVLLIILLILTITIAGWRGITALAGLALSIVVIFAYIVPMILAGRDAFLTCIAGAVVIAVITVFIAHGFNRRSAVALLGTLVTLGVTVLLSMMTRLIVPLYDLVDQESLSANLIDSNINLSGILFGGIVIASLGVLNDITIGQAATVDELHAANKKLKFAKLYKAGHSVGREHIAALINTLAIAYIGVALASVVVLVALNKQPLAIILSSQYVSEEIVRTAIVSISLLLAVPVTTALAAWLIPRWTARRLKHRKRPPIAFSK